MNSFGLRNEYVVFDGKEVYMNIGNKFVLSQKCFTEWLVVSECMVQESELLAWWKFTLELP